MKSLQLASYIIFITNKVYGHLVSGGATTVSNDIQVHTKFSGMAGRGTSITVNV